MPISKCEERFELLTEEEQPKGLSAMQVHSRSIPTWHGEQVHGAGEVSAGAADERLKQAHQLQNTFTAVLAQFGREGFASAEPLPVDIPTETAITSSWNEWFDQFGGTAYRSASEPGSGGSADVDSVQTLKQDYGQILVDAYNAGGYLAPTKFLQSLDREQLEAIQTIHRLAHPIDVYQLEDEGATNLLIPPAAQVDFDGDGLTQVGIGRTIRFPDSSTPTKIRDAWESATAGLSMQQRAMYELQMKLPIMTANIQPDGSGGVRSVEPGDAAWVNPMASPSYSFEQAITDRLDYLDAFKNQIPVEQWARDRDFWSSFRDLLAA